MEAIDARRAAEAEHTRLIDGLTASLARSEQLLDLTHALAGALTLEAVADVVTDHARTALHCLFAGVALIDEERRLMRYVSMAPLPAHIARAWTEFPFDLRVPATDTVRLGRPLRYRTREEIAGAYPAISTDLAQAGTQAMVTVPLSVAGHTIGSLMLTWSEAHHADEDELRFLETFAGHAAQAIERSRLFARQRSVAAALQRAILPDRLPAPPGLEITARYEPAEQGLEVGGDWYDAFELPDGRLALTVGDVSGHGVTAAATMAQLRNAARAHAMDGDDPPTLLTKLNRLLHQAGGEKLASLVFAVVDLRSGALEWSSAGHPPPLMVSGRTARYLDDVHGPMLGVVAEATYGHSRSRMDGALLLYTDGLIEHRTRDLTDGLDALRAAAEQSCADLEAYCDHVMAAALHGRTREDDLCILVARRDGGQDPAASRPQEYTVLEPDPRSVGAARAFVRAFLRAHGPAEIEDDATLLVSELVTNAVLHVASEIELMCHVDSGTLCVQIGDRSPTLPGRRHFDKDALTGRGIGIVDELATAWGVEADDAGKTVWFQLAGPDADPDAGAPAPSPTRQDRQPQQQAVCLLAAPLELLETTVQYDESLLRELALSARELREPTVGLPNRQGLDLTPVLGAVAAARQGGSGTTDFDVALPAGSGSAAEARLALLGEADRLAGSGRLLLPPALPEVALCRAWLLTEIQAQEAGAAPRAWQQPEPAPPAMGTARLLDADRAALDQLTEAVIVADDGNTIVYANAALAELLDWSPDELIGERLVTIVPPQLREAHLAGFSRYLMTAEPRLIGRTVQVPALRRDGSRLDVALTLSEMALADGRRGFRATLTAVPQPGPAGKHT